MHGSLFTLFKRFVETNYDYATWVTLTEKAKINNANYEMSKVYPDEEMFSLIDAASEMTGLSPWTLQEQFGEALVPDLMFVYKQYIRPGWKTMDVIEYTEKVFHTAAKEKQPGVTPPVLIVSRINKNQLVVDYFSKRKMGSLAIGIIRGLAKFYHEEDKIQIESTTKPDAEKVQIKVNYLSLEKPHQVPL